MELLEQMKRRRSIRKYLPKPVEHEKLVRIAEAGIYAPSPGGRQGVKIVMLSDPELIHKIGVVNANCENRDWGQGVGVSAEQPSIIDDKTIQSGFYGCQALGILFVGERMSTHVNGIGSAFVCAQNMVLEAQELGVSSCIVGRAEVTFSQPDIAPRIAEWGLEGYVPLVCVCLGYIDGKYPDIKARDEGRVIFPNM